MQLFPIMKLRIKVFSLHSIFCKTYLCIYTVWAVFILLTYCNYNGKCFYVSDITMYLRTSNISQGNATTNKTVKEERPRFVLLVGILSKLSAYNRREAIRNTWMISCKEIQSIYCVFFTDTVPGAPKLTEKHVIQMPTPSGMDFARRLLAMFEWAVASYEFDFFLRVDDDYFLCMDHLHYDVVRRPRKGLYWGYVHCQPNIVRIDEGWMITSADIVKEILSKRNTTLMCHPFGDQAASIWMKDSKIDIKYFHDNERVIHADAFGNSVKYLQADVCDRVLGLHGTSAKKMYNYWNITEFIGDKRTRRRLGGTYFVPEIQPFHKKCYLPVKLDWKMFGSAYRHKPKLCRLNPTWSTAKGEYSGRGVI